MNGVSKGEAKGAAHRSAARLAAVQSLYQLALDPEATGVGVVDEFRAHRLGKELEGALYHAADEDFFRDIVVGVGERRDELDALIRAHLAKNWRFERLETLICAILRAGAYELAARPDVPTAVVVNEYVDVAKAFYGGDEPGFVNGLLDAIAREVRT